VRVAGEGDMQADKIGLLQERVLLDPGGIEFGFEVLSRRWRLWYRIRM
jgi:hypothetical protein